MDNQRSILFIALLFVGLLLWQAWEQDHAPVATAIPGTAGTKAVASAVPELPASSATPAAGLDVPGAQASVASAEAVVVDTDLLKVELNTMGGDLRKTFFKHYPVTLEHPEKKLQLLDDDPAHFFVAQSGLISKQTPVPDHHALFVAEQKAYQLQPGQNELKVRMHWDNKAGILVTKEFTFHRDSYVVDVNYMVQNTTAQPLALAMYRQLQRGSFEIESANGMLYTFTGGVISNQDNKYEKLEFDDMKDWRSAQDFSQGGWAAMLQHYFITAWLAGDKENNHFYARQVEEGRYVVGLTTPEQSVAAGQTASLASRIYVGPKEQHRLEKAASNLVLTVDYGLLTIISQPLYWLMEQIHKIVNNWGWTIILLTLVVKLCFYKLTETQYKSMANMRRLQPKLEALKERFGDDRQKMGQAMMEMYKKEKINPLAGCLPIVVQIPVFIALYWVLVESVELRQAPFILWINDLSAMDPYYVLPLLMGVSMFVMQKLSPAPADPIQAKMMMALPFVFTVFFAFFPAGLVLYWLANNLLSISQQWYITRKIEQAAAK